MFFLSLQKKIWKFFYLSKIICKIFFLKFLSNKQKKWNGRSPPYGQPKLACPAAGTNAAVIFDMTNRQRTWKKNILQHFFWIEFRLIWTNRRQKNLLKHIWAKTWSTNLKQHFFLFKIGPNLEHYNLPSSMEWSYYPL